MRASKAWGSAATRNLTSSPVTRGASFCIKSALAAFSLKRFIQSWACSVREATCCSPLSSTQAPSIKLNTPNTLNPHLLIMAHLRGEHFHHPVARGQPQLNGFALLAHDLDQRYDRLRGVAIGGQIDVGNRAPTHPGVPKKGPPHRGRQRLQSQMEQVTLVDAVLHQNVVLKAIDCSLSTNSTNITNTN